MGLVYMENENVRDLVCRVNIQADVNDQPFSEN